MRDDIFLLDTGRDGVHLVYAPKHLAMFAVNTAGAEAFQKLRNGECDSQTETLRLTLEKARLDKEPPSIPSNIQHANLTICPTFQCNLACHYCFARGGERLNDLSLKAAMAAVDLALTRYPLVGDAKKSQLTWHGGGEPSLAWPLIRDVSQYHREKALGMGFVSETSIVSNGLWSEAIKTWVMDGSIQVSISCDGPADIQDLQRPLSNGLPSSPRVFSTLVWLAESGVDFGIRSTITEHNVRRMPEMVEFFYSLCQPKTLQFERLAVCGRCEDTQIGPGSAEYYIESFKEAFDLAHSLSINLACSGVRIFRRTSSFCGAAGKTMCIMPNGLLTTCHRVDDLADLLAGEFIYGNWQGEEYQWDQGQLRSLSQKLNVGHLDWCQDCFCKYTCAGGCSAARFSDTGNLHGRQSDDRCLIVRELTRHRLISVAQERGLFNQIH